ncbi:MAG TPA: S9 family peptidase, partial [Gemmatimonadales bacterium]
MRHSFLIAVALLVSSSTAHAQSRPMTADDIIALRQVGDAQVSPDGKWVVYTVTAADLKENAYAADLWLVSTSGGTPVRLTSHPKADNTPRWSPDGTRIAFLSAREERPQIWLISPFGGEPEKLTSSKTAIQDLEWSPDGSRIAFVAPRDPSPEDERRQRERDDRRVVDSTFNHGQLWIVEVAGAKVSEAVTGDFHVADPQWSPDGSRIAFTMTPSPKPDDGGLSDVHILDVAARRWDRLLQHEGPDGSARWSPDGREIALLVRDGPRRATGQPWLAVVDARGGTPRRVAPGFLYQPSPVTWSADGSTLYFTAATRTTSQLFSVPASGGSPRQLTDVAGVLGGGTASRDGAVWAFTLADMQRPAEVALVRGGGQPVRITDMNPQVRQLALGRGEVVRWKGRDDKEIEGLLLYPVGYQEGRRYPTIALIHGGPAGVWAQGFPATWGNFGHIWAGQGWAVFYPNVRGSSGYGETFLLSNVRDWGGGDYQDIQSGLDDLVRRGIADPARLGQSGWSYGGYMTAWTLTQTNRFKAVMVGAGLTNMVSMYSTNDLQTTLEEYFGA